MSINISIDPGTNHTGVCVWVNGSVHEIRTFHAPKVLEYPEKLMWIQSKLVNLFSQINEDIGQIDQIAVEEWENFYGKRPNMKAMMKCSEVRGLIIGEAWHWSKQTPIRISKGQIKKVDTNLLAKAHGIEGAQDGKDAFQIGICAGFDIPDKRKE